MRQYPHFIPLFLTTFVSAYISYVKAPYYLQPSFIMVVSQDVDSIQACIDLVAPYDNVTFVEFQPSTDNLTGSGNCRGRETFLRVAFGYPTKVIQYIKYRGCSSACSQQMAERVVIESLYGQTPCPSYDPNSSAGFITQNMSIDLSAQHCYMIYNTSCRAQPPLYNWAVALQNTDTNATFKAVLFTRAQALQATDYTCSPSIRYRFPINGTYYCFDYITSVLVSNTTLNNVSSLCPTILDNGYPIRLLTSNIYIRLFGGNYCNSQFAGLVTYDGRTYVYVDNTTISTTDVVNWKTGYPQGNPFVFVNQDLELQDVEGPFNRTLGCMAPSILRS